jgi:hypothetical protein
MIRTTFSERGIPMSEERTRILQMVSENKIDAEQGIQLLSALKNRDEAEPPTPPLTGTAKWLRIRVTNLETGRAKVNVNLPFSLVKAGLKLGSKFSPEMSDVDWQEIVAAIDEGALGKLVDVEDLEGGEKVEIYVE